MTEPIAPGGVHRAALLAQFEDIIDPQRKLPDEERRAAAERALVEHMRALSRKGVETRQRRLALAKAVEKEVAAFKAARAT